MRAVVGPMVGEYAAWIACQATEFDDQRAQVARDLLANARRAQGRIQDGLDAGGAAGPR